MKTVVDLVTSLKSYFIGKDTAAKQAVEANIAPVETDATSASQGYSQGAQLILNDVLYDVTATITAGDALAVGTNIAAADDISTEIGAVNSALSNKQDSTLASAVTIGGTSRTTVEGALGALADSAYLEDGLTLSSATKALTANQGLQLANKHKVTKKTVNTSSWSSDTTSQSGSTLYKKTISLSHVYVDRPSVEISTSSGTGLPTTAQQTAYDLLQYATVDSSVPALYLYASEVPSSTFYITIEGVD